MREVYTIGYAGRTADELEGIIEELGAVVWDIRYRPYSKSKEWCREALRERLGSDYRHVRAFGNKTYKAGEIDIADFDAGLALLETGDQPVILMCACWRYVTCHRKVIGDRLRDLGYKVEPLFTRSKKRESKYQQLNFALA